MSNTPVETVKVRLLRECEFGQCNDVVFIDAALVPSYSAGGVVDASASAIAYAESVK
jgi:hypothetical protein